MRLAAALLLFLLGAAPAPAAEKPVPLTWESVSKMPDEELARRVFGDLGHVMYPRPRGGRVSTRFPPALRKLEFVTRPRASYRAGLCATDTIHVGFERVGFALGDDPPVRPYRFDKYENYFIQDFKTARTGEALADEGARSELEAACREIDPRTKRLIVASSDFEVVDGLDSLADLIEAAERKRALAPLECKDRSGEPVSEANCLVRLSHLDPLDLYHSKFVEGCGRKDPLVYCRSLNVHDLGDGMDIDLEYKHGGKAPLRVRVKPSFDETSLYP